MKFENMRYDTNEAYYLSMSKGLKFVLSIKFFARD